MNLRNRGVMQLTYAGKTDEIIGVEEGYTFPSMSKKVTYSDTSHASYRKRKRSILDPFSFFVPIMLFNRSNQIGAGELNERINKLLYSKGPEILKLEGVNWYVIGEFNGPFDFTHQIYNLTSLEVEFTSSYPYKFYDGERIQTADKSVTISTKTQIPTTPLIELTGLTGNDVQISISGDSFRRIRLTGNLPSNLTIDIENEKIYETNSGVNRINLLRIDSAFEDFRIEHGDVVVLTNAGSNARARLTYKELLL